MRVMRHLVFAGLCAAIAAMAGRAGAAERVETIPTRPGVTQPLYIVEPDAKPWAVALLYVGGDGNMSLGANGPTKELGNFLLRIANQLKGAGLLLVYPDVPSDMSTGLGNLRNGDKQVADAAATLGWIRQRTDAPVFVVGTSRGTVSAANIGAHLPPGSLAGVILTSSITRASKQLGAVDDKALAEIRVPTLVVHHKDDACNVTKPADIPQFVESLRAAPRKDLVWISGGSPPKAGPCEGKAAHGYFGVEREATTAMLDWMKSVAARR
ncbi:MAG: alpha/beta hydrolase [Gemmatimonas sp.]